MTDDSPREERGTTGSGDGGGLDARLDRAARSLPAPDAPPQLWRDIRTRLEQERRPSLSERDSALTAWLLGLTALGPRWSVALVAILLVLGAAAGIMLVMQPSRHQQQAAERVEMDSDQLMAEAQDDIAHAMFYYERAIERLSVLAERNEDRLDPEFVAVQKEKVEMLRVSIDECKRALDQNRLHPDVQRSLLMAYSELQATLQEIAGAKN